MRKFAYMGALAACLVAGTAAAEPIVLKGVTPWQADYDLSQAFFIFKELVDERLGGKLEIQYLGGPEVQQPNDQFDALRNGVVDVILGAAAYYRAEVPMAAAVQFSRKPPSELRKSGYFEIMKEIHAEKDVVYLANTAGANKFRMYLLNKVEKPDFSGLAIRVSPVYLPMVQALGGTPATIAPGEVYTALERGTIQGYGWTYTGIGTFGWDEKTKYVIDHPFYSLDGALLVNKAAYDALPDDVKQALDEIAVELEKRVEEFFAGKFETEDAELREKGIEFLRFSDDDAAKFLDTAYKAGWDDFLAKNKQVLDQNPALVEQLRQTGE